MPWAAGDVKHKSKKAAATPGARAKWVKRANAIREDAVEQGASEKAADKKAIRIANWMAGKKK